MISKDIKQLKDIFTTFFKIGLFTFGGGYAMLPLIEKETVERKKWIEREEIADIIALSESIPGAIAINSATFIGTKISGKKGAIVAALGVILPSFLVITTIATFFSKFGDSLIIKAAFTGIRPAVTALIALAAYKIGKTVIKDKAGLVVAVIATVLVIVFSVHAIFAIIGGIVFGLAVYRFWPEKTKEILGKEDKKK